MSCHAVLKISPQGSNFSPAIAIFSFWDAILKMLAFLLLLSISLSFSFVFLMPLSFSDKFWEMFFNLSSRLFIYSLVLFILFIQFIVFQFNCNVSSTSMSFFSWFILLPSFCMSLSINLMLTLVFLHVIDSFHFDFLPLYPLNSLCFVGSQLVFSLGYQLSAWKHVLGRT